MYGGLARGTGRPQRTLRKLFRPGQADQPLLGGGERPGIERIDVALGMHPQQVGTRDSRGIVKVFGDNDTVCKHLVPDHRVLLDRKAMAGWQRKGVPRRAPGVEQRWLPGGEVCRAVHRPAGFGEQGGGPVEIVQRNHLVRRMHVAVGN